MYIMNTWITGEVISAVDLMRMENGIRDIHERGDSHISDAALHLSVAQVNIIDSVIPHIADPIHHDKLHTFADHTDTSVTGADLDQDHTKLAGIDVGATDDQTATEILTALKTVDGAGSGLDAELLDGNASSIYAKLGNNVNSNSMYYNRVIQHVEEGITQYWVLCRNAGGNNVNGTVRLERTSGNYQSANLDIVVSSGASAMYGGALTSLQVVQSGEVYKLVTVTRISDGLSYVAIKYTGNSYPVSSGVFFTGRLATTAGSITFTTLLPAAINNEADFGGNTKFNVNADILSVNEDIVMTSANIGSYALPVTGPVTLDDIVTMSHIGETLRIGGTNALDTDDAWIYIGNDTLAWNLKYIGTTSDTGGNEFRIESAGSSGTGKFVQMDHDGNFEHYDGATINKFWHAGNDGAGSGLDADKLDGIDHSNYARTDIEEVFANSVGIGGATPDGTFDNGKALALGDSDTGIRQNGDGQLELWANNQEIANFTNSCIDLYKSVNLLTSNKTSVGGATSKYTAGGNYPFTMAVNGPVIRTYSNDVHEYWGNSLFFAYENPAYNVTSSGHTTGINNPFRTGDTYANIYNDSGDNVIEVTGPMPSDTNVNAQRLYLQAHGSINCTLKVEVQRNDNVWVELANEAISLGGREYWFSSGLTSVVTYPDHYGLKGFRWTFIGLAEAHTYIRQLGLFSYVGMNPHPFIEAGGDTMYGDLSIANGTVKIAGSAVWHAGNDGETSGLHADLLDNKHYTDIQTDWNADIATHTAIATAHHSNANDPTTDQKAALAGTAGTPSATNKFVTDDDTRLDSAPAAHTHLEVDITDLGDYEIAFSKNTGFNKDFGITVDTVSEGNHSHTLDGLSDVATFTPGWGEIIQFRQPQGWTNATLAEAGIAGIYHNHDSDYLGITAKATDSELLDNLNSTQFLRSDTSDTMTGDLTINGNLGATTKSFLIDHPTKAGKLQHGCLEGPEHAVYIRGRVKGYKIKLPDYWTGLIDESTITVQLTAVGKSQDLYVKDIIDNYVFINNNNANAFYFIQAERKDVNKLVIEWE